MQHPRAPVLRALEREFQSSSGQKAGCNLSPQFPAGDVYMFQSSSGQKAGCNL